MDITAFEAAQGEEDELTFSEIYHRLPRGPKSVIEVTIFAGGGIASFAAIIVTVVGSLTAYCLMLGWICLFWLTSQLLLRIAAFLRICYEIEVPLTPASQRKSQSPRQHETWEEGREERLAVPIDDLATVLNRTGISEYVWPTASSEVKQSSFENLEHPPETSQDRSSALLPEHVEIPRTQNVVARSPMSSHGRRESMGHSLQSGDEQHQAQPSDKEAQQIFDFERSESQQAEVERLTGKKEPRLKELMAHERARAKRERRTQMQEEEQTAWLERLKPRSPVKAKFPSSPSTSTARDIANPSPPTSHSTSGDAHHTHVSWGTKEALDAAASFSRDIRLAREAKKAYYIDNSTRTEPGNSRAPKASQAPQSTTVPLSKASIPKLMNSRTVVRSAASQSSASAQTVEDGGVQTTGISTLPPHLRRAAKKNLEDNVGEQDVTQPLESTMHAPPPNSNCLAKASVKATEPAKEAERATQDSKHGDSERPPIEPARETKQVARNVAPEESAQNLVDARMTRLSYDEMLRMDHDEWSAKVRSIAGRRSPAATECEPAPPVRNQPGCTMSSKQLKAFNTLPRKGSTHGMHTGDGLDAVEDHDADTQCTRCKRWTSSLYTSDADLCPPCLTIESRIDDALRIINDVAAGATSSTSFSRNKRSNALQDGHQLDRQPKRATTPVCWTCGMHHDGLCLKPSSDSASEMREVDRPKVHQPGLSARTVDDSDLSTGKQSNGTKASEVAFPATTGDVAQISSSHEAVYETPKLDSHQEFAQTREVFDHVSPSSTGRSSPATVDSSNRSSSLQFGPSPQRNNAVQQAVAALKAQAHQKRASLNKLNGALEQTRGEDRSTASGASGGSIVPASIPTHNAAKPLNRLPESENPFSDAHAVGDRSHETGDLRDASKRTSPEKQSSRSSSLNASAPRFRWKATQPLKTSTVTSAPRSMHESALQVNAVPPTPSFQNIDWTLLTEQWSDHSEVDPARSWTGWGYHIMDQTSSGDNPSNSMHFAAQPLLSYAAQQAHVGPDKISSAIPIVRPSDTAPSKDLPYDDAFPQLGAPAKKADLTPARASSSQHYSGQRLPSSQNQFRTRKAEETLTYGFGPSCNPCNNPIAVSEQGNHSEASSVRQASDALGVPSSEYDQSFPPLHGSVKPSVSLRLPGQRSPSKAIPIASPSETDTVDKRSKKADPSPIAAPPGLSDAKRATQGTFDALLAGPKENLDPAVPKAAGIDQRFQFTFKHGKQKEVAKPKTLPEGDQKRTTSRCDPRSTDDGSGTPASKLVIDGTNRNKGFNRESSSANQSLRLPSPSIRELKAFSGRLDLNAARAVSTPANGSTDHAESACRDEDTQNKPPAVDNVTAEPIDTDGEASQTIKKRKRAARGALRDAWQAREQIRTRLAATYTLDATRALEEATKTYNEKRSELATCMASGKLNEEDAKVLPIFAKGDLSAPIIRPKSTDNSPTIQNDGTSLSHPGQGEANDSAPVEPVPKKIKSLLDRAIRARKVYTEAHAYFDKPPPPGKVDIQTLRAEGEAKIERTTRFYRLCRIPVVDAYGAEGLPEWIQKELWTYDDDALKKNREKWPWMPDT